uniref:Uncharacterized protein n=1 Tax=Strongyloides venezuelensis TaxID=75913 RepID=A0A0K0F2D3_STRVS
MTNVSMPDNTASLLQRINFNMPVLSYGRDINNESSTIRNAFQSSIVSYGTVEPNILWNNMNEFQQKISNTFPFQSNTFLTLQNVQQKQLLTSFQQTHQISVTDKITIIYTLTLHSRPPSSNCLLPIKDTVTGSNQVLGGCA